MTNYKVEIYSKGARQPSKVFMAALDHGFRPKYTDTEECFGRQLDKAYRVDVRYASNGGLVAKKRYNRKGRGYLSWF